LTPHNEIPDLRSTRLAPFVVAFLMLSTAIVYIGHLYYSTKQLYFKEQSELTLSAVAELKVNQLTNWWATGIADAHRIRSNGFLVEHMRNLRKGHAGATSRDLIERWLESLQETGGYHSVLLLDTSGMVLFSKGEAGTSIDPEERSTLKSVVRSHEIMFTDFHEPETGGEVRCDFWAPVIDARPEGDVIAGVMALRVDPVGRVNPLIATWPNASQSSEMTLLRREGDEVVYLNSPRHRKGTPLRFRFPLTDSSLVAVRAVVGQQGFVEGVDYRGIAVKAFARKVPGTPWVLVAQTELSEINDPLNGIAKWVTSLSIAMIAAAGLGLGLWRRHRQAQNYRARLREETQRSQALAALHIAEDRFTKVFRRSPVPMCVLRLADGVILDANESFGQLFGYSMQELINNPSAGFNFWMSPDGNATDTRWMADNGGIANLECPLRKKSGEVGMQLLSSERIALGGVDCLLVTAIDISSRKLAEEALRETNERFEKVFRTSPVLMSLSSLTDGTIVEANNACEQALGFSRQEIIGKTFEEIGWVSKADWSGIRETVRHRDHIRNLALQMSRKDGQTMYCNFSAEVVNHRGKKFLLCVAEDITEQMRSEEQLARSAREKEELLKELQHRVKNNLSLIAALLEFGMKSIEDERSRQAFIDAQSRIRTMGRIYDQLYQSSALKDIEADVYLSRLATSVIQTYAVNAEKIHLTMRLHPVKMDMKRMVALGLIVNELVTNAVKYAFPDGNEGEVRLSFEKLNKSIVLTVSDDGVGLPQGMDLKNAESLGFSIVTMLADQLQAELLVTGDKGTSVTLTFEF
jgi:PAS domain S-box-containing protein